MVKKFERELNKKEDLKITYYFTVLLTIVGTLLTMYFLSYKVEGLNLFVILLSISAGGLPFGIVGAFFDYKMSTLKKKQHKYNESISNKEFKKSLEKF